MGILDELKKEAEAASAEKARETTSRAETLKQAHARLDPAMAALYKYFGELKQHLQVLNKEVLAAYDIKDVGRVEGLKQGQYGLSTETPEQVQKFTFRCVCAKPGVLQATLRDANAVAAYRDYLRDAGLQAKVRDAGAGAAQFLVQPAVPVSVEFSADYAQVCIRLRVRNLTSVGVTWHLLAPEQVNEKFMDELAKALLRQGNRFNDLVGNTVSDTSKMRIKRKIQAAMRQKELQAELDRREAQQQESITKRFSRTLLGRKDD